MAHQAFGQAGGKLRELWGESSFYVENRPKVVVQELEIKTLSFKTVRQIFLNTCVVLLKIGRRHEPDFWSWIGVFAVRL